MGKGNCVKVRRKVKVGKFISSEAGKTGKNIKVRRKVKVGKFNQY